MESTESTASGAKWRRIGIAAGLFAILYVPFAAKPVHIDDANFLMLAEGAARDPWRPHNLTINWSGTTEPAFDILANPPGIAWYLAPVRHSPEWVLHLWMLPWLALGGWGCWRLGMDFAGGSGFLAAVYLLTCPVVVISTHALTPDLPVFACMSAGIAGFYAFPRLRAPFALLAGCTALFRYSGCTVVPLLILIGWQRQSWRGVALAFLSAVPIALLVLHDLDAYNRVHLLAMFSSQNDSQKTVVDSIHNMIAGIAMLGGAAVLPVLVWRRESIIGAIIGAAVGLDAAWLTGLTVNQTIPAVLSTAAGAAALSLAFAPRTRDPILSVWALGGAAFFFVVRFAATRYWAAFFPAVGLLAFRNAQRSKSWLTAGIAMNTLISFGVAVDDQNLAQAYRDAAKEVASRGTGTFSGHWGWQHYLEKAGWTPIERNGQPGALHAIPVYGDAQLPDPSVCLRLVDRFSMPDRWPGPRVYSRHDRAFYHAGGGGSYAPWTLSDEPYDVISVYRRCDTETDTANEKEKHAQPEGQ